MRYTHSIRNKWVSGCGVYHLFHICRVEGRAASANNKACVIPLSIPFSLPLYISEKKKNAHEIEPSYRNTDL